MTDTTPYTPNITSAIIEVEKTIRDRERYWQDAIERGRARLKPETIERKQADLRHAQTLLTWLERNLSWIKPEAEVRATRARLAAEAETLRDHPAVAAVLDEFPGAEITDVREIETGEVA